MIAVDTNVVVRLLTADSPTQYKSSVKIFSSHDIFLAHTVLLETEWVLRAAYRLTSEQICNALRGVVALPNVYVEDPHLLAEVLQWHESGLDFADAYHLALSRKCQALKTFDAQFIRHAKDLSPCRVEKV